jgi:hypothetical protein
LIVAVPVNVDTAKDTSPTRYTVVVEAREIRLMGVGMTTPLPAATDMMSCVMA